MMAPAPISATPVCACCARLTPADLPGFRGVAWGRVLGRARAGSRSFSRPGRGPAKNAANKATAAKNLKIRIRLACGP